MAWAFVQATAGTVAAASSATVLPGVNITAGNRLVAVVCVNYNAAGGTVTVSDSAANVWFVESSSIETVDSILTVIASAPITAGGGTRPTVTATYSTTAFNTLVDVLEYSGLITTSGATASDQKQVNNASTATTAPVSGTTAATTAANELVLAAWGEGLGNATAAVGTGTTDRLKTLNLGTIDLVVSDKDSGATGTQSVAWTTTSEPYAAAVVVFKLSGGAAVLRPRRPLVVRQAVNRAGSF